MGRASSASALHEGPYGAGGTLAPPPAFFGLNDLGRLDSWDLSKHRTDEHHGVFTVPLTVTGASQILS